MNGPNPTVQAVFDGANCLIEAGRTVANGIGAMYNCAKALDNPNGLQQNTQALYSRRNDGCGYGIPQAQPGQYQVSYQPAPYPWANANPYGQPQYQGGYALTGAGNQMGYPGISYPGYGRAGGFAGSTFVGNNYNTSFVSPQPLPQQQTLPQFSGNSWVNQGVWG